MTPELFQEVAEIFLAVRSVASADRGEVLASRCGNRDELRREVERLLDADDQRGDGLDDDQMHAGLDLDGVRGLFTIGGSASPEAWQSEELLPATVGRYRIIRKLGEGGMGIVCEAEQDNPRRLVAIKLLRPGLGSRGLIRRFEQEAQILARLHHPCIARIYDAGATGASPGGQPYFAMELITGRPLLEHAAELSIGDRLRLFLLICNAVEYAHGKGVIHRDLKPANILVDEHGQPRIMDFGVAHATDADLQVTTLRTDPRQLVGTLPYMSPEQLSGNASEVDARTDVYALGVLLYQLLSGRLPLDTRNKTIAEAARVIRDLEPTRIGSLDTAFRGDLDVIVSRALEKDVTRRYQSAASLGTDIERHLNHIPIEARPPSGLYQARKFARRHPELVLGLGIAATVAIVGLVGTSWGLVHATAQRDEAQRSAAKATRLAKAMQRILEASNPQSIDGSTDGAVKILNQAAKNIGSELSEEPESEWTLRMTLGQTFRGLGANDYRIENLRRAEDISQSRFQESDSRRAATSQALSNAYADLVTSGFASRKTTLEARRFILRELEVARRVWGDQHPITLSLLNDAAYLSAYSREGAAGAELQRELIAALRLLPPDKRPCPLAFALSRLAFCLAWNHDQGSASVAAEESIALFTREEEPGDEDTMSRQLGLQDYLIETGQLRQAADLLRTSISRIERSRGPSHPKTIAPTLVLVQLLDQLGDAASAIALNADRLATSRVLAGRWSPQLVYQLSAHAHLLSHDGRLERAEATLAEAREIIERDAKTRLSGMPAEFWRATALICGLRVGGRWASETLRAEAVTGLGDQMSSFPSASLNPSDIRWDEFQFRMVRHGSPATAPLVGDLNTIWVTPDPPPGLYEMTVSVPDGEGIRRVRDWVLVSPWHVCKYGALFRTITRSDEWAARTALPADEELVTSTLTAQGWNGRGFGPVGREYAFGLVADSTIDVPSGDYEFALAADDGAVLFLDGRRIIDAWPDSEGDKRCVVRAHLTPGPHALHLEYVQWGDMSRLRLRLTPAQPQLPK